MAVGPAPCRSCKDGDEKLAVVKKNGPFSRRKKTRRRRKLVGGGERLLLKCRGGGSTRHSPGTEEQKIEAQKNSESCFKNGGCVFKRGENPRVETRGKSAHLQILMNTLPFVFLAGRNLLRVDWGPLQCVVTSSFQFFPALYL